MGTERLAPVPVDPPTAQVATTTVSAPAAGPGRGGSDVPAGGVEGRNLTRRASLNSVAAGLDFGARLAVELVVNKLLVVGLGDFLFGAWRVLWQWTGYVWATSGRSPQALQYAVANRQHSDDAAEKRSYVASALVVWVLYLPLLCAIGGFGIWYAPTFLDAPDAYVAPVRWAAALLVAESILLTLLTIPRAVLQGENLGYKRMGVSAVLVLLGGGLTAAAVHLDTGIAGVAGAHLLTTVLTGLLFWHVTLRHVPWFGLARPTRRTVRWFLGLSSWFLAWKLVTQLMMASDVLILGAFASVSLVSVYVLTKFVADALNRLLVVLVNGVTPGMAGVIGAGETDRAVRLRAEMHALTWLVTTVVGATILLWNGAFVSAWFGPQYDAGQVAILLIVVMTVQYCLIRNDSYLIDATLDLRAKVWVGAASVVLTVVLAAVLVGPADLGIPGLVAGIVAGRVVLSVVYPWKIGRALGHPLRRQLRGALRPGFVAALLFTGAAVVGGSTEDVPWLVLLPGTLVSAAVLLPVGALLGLTGAQRRALVTRARAVVTAGRGAS